MNELVCKVLRGETNRPPDDDGLTLEWVHGYRSDDCRNNVRYAASGELVYHAAAVNVVMDVKGPKQRFCHVHSDDIVSMAMHPEGQIVATGQIGKQPKIQVSCIAADALSAAYFLTTKGYGSESHTL